MSKLNAEQVKKALECCENELCDACMDCPSPPNTSGSCTVFVMRQALALITSQEQRIKELTEENEKIGIENFDLICELSRIKADTVRKMQERLTQMVLSNFPNLQGLPLFIDKIAKEMLDG